MASNQRELENLGWKGIFVGLSYQADAARANSARPLRQRTCVEEYCAAHRRSSARERMQCQRLADAILSKYCDELACMRAQVELLHEQPAGNGDIKLLRLKQRAHYRRFQLISRADLGPITAASSESGMSQVVGDSIMRPAIISTRDCGVRGFRSGSA